MGNFNRGGRADRGQGGGRGGFGGQGGGFGGRGGYGGGRDREGSERQLFQATCAECGNACDVPFRPSGNKPVYCRDCFAKINVGPSGRSDDRGARQSGGHRDFDRPRFADKRMYSAVCEQCGNSCEVPFQPTGDKPVFCRNCFGKGGKASGSGGVGGKSGEHIDQQFAQLNEKLDKILKRLTPSYLRDSTDEDADAVGSEVVDETAVESVAETKLAVKKAKAKKKAV